MKSNHLLRACSLLILLVSLLPVNGADALVATAPPPVDMFQLPWDLGIAWVAIDGIDNGSKRPLSSSHNYSVGGAIDFAPRSKMVTGENTSNFWVTAAAAGTVIEISSCHMKIAHGNGWLTEYQFLGNIQVKLGDAVGRNQRLGIIADGVRQKYCPGSLEINVPHLHFMLRPTMIGATFAGWLVNYNSFFNTTTFTKNGSTVGLFQPLMNVMDSPPTPTPTLQPTSTPTNLPSPTPTLSGPYVSTAINPQSIDLGESALVTVSLNNVPAEGYTSAEFTCTYNSGLFEVSSITTTSLFGADAASAINGPQDHSFIVAIAGSNGNKATTSGPAFTFNVKGLQVGQTVIECRARVSEGNNVLVEIPFVVDYLTILGDTPTPNLTPSYTPTVTQPPAPNTPTVSPTLCDKAELIADVTIPAGTVLQPGAQFTKTWRLQNVGTCVWTTSYQLVFFSGEQMSAPSSVSFPMSVAAGQTVDLSLNMTAPLAAGSYRGNWMFKNANGTLFGTGPQANEPFAVDIMASGSTITPGGSTQSPTPTFTPVGPTPITGIAYDFVANACSATWSSGAGQLPCPGVDGDSKGFVLKINNPKLETGATDIRPGLLTFPQNVQNGYIQGFYPAFKVQSGDRFRSTINCEFGATNCYVAFRLDYQTGSDAIKTFWGPFLERYEGQSFSVDVDLSSLAGKDVKFILTVLAAGATTGDRALWVGPIIYRAGAVSTAVPSATPPSDWLTFTNSTYGFQFLYPAGGQILAGNTDTYARINLPFVQGTNLQQKYLEVIVAENANPCRSPLATSSILETSETVIINGISFLKETGGDGTAGHINTWTAYSTSRDNVCVSLDFVLRAANPGVFSTPPPVFDEAAETAVFGQIVATYTWLTLPTATPGGSATPTFTPTPVESPTPTFTSTPASSPTPAPADFGNLAGQVTADKPVIVNVYDANNTLIGSTATTLEGMFGIGVLPGTYTVIATASGYLSAQGSVTLTAGNTSTKPTITLLAGDIDNNNVINQFDALTIGMGYNTALPGAADLNNDGIINVLDLELLAENYRETGPVAW